METIHLHFPPTWTHNRCDEWMIHNQLSENGREIKDGKYVYHVLVKENEVEQEEQPCLSCSHLVYNCICEA